MQEIVQGIYYENVYPGVVLGALLLPHGTILVDAPLRAEDARAWRAALLTQGASSNRLLVNLDAHTDRTLGARAMESTIVAHQKTAQVFRSRPSIFKGQNADSGAEWEAQNDAVGTRWAIPDITFNQSLAVHWGPPDVFFEHRPGPSAGAVWAILPDVKVIFVGDAVLSHQPGFLAGSDIPAWIETLDVLIAEYSDFIVVSGRSGPVAAEEVNDQQQHIKNVLTGLERLGKRNAPAEATEELLPVLMADLDIHPKLEEQYTQRLRHGLFQYYARRYRPTEYTETS